MIALTGQADIKRGRKPDPAKLQNILETGTKLFSAQGYSATTLFDVAKQANVSRVTLYSYYPDKKTFFEACLVYCTAKLWPTLFELRLDPSLPKQGLQDLAADFINMIRSPELVSAFRVMVGLRLEINFLQAKPVAQEAQQATIAELEQISAMFHRTVTHNFKQRVIDFLHAANQAKSLQVDDTEYAAELFGSMFLDSSYISLLLMGQPYPRPIADQALCAKHINTFLRLYGMANG